MPRALIRAGIPLLVLAAAGAAGPAPAADRASANELVLCSQNLWNYGAPGDVKRLRRAATPLDVVTKDLARQERDLAERMGGCDVVAVQEVLGGDAASAQAALDRLAAALPAGAGERWIGRVGDAKDVIRTGFLVRLRPGREIESFEPGSAGRPLPRVAGCPRAFWDRSPSTLRLREAGRTIVLVSVHLKSKADSGGARDEFGEHHERRRLVQAFALSELARKELKADPRRILVIAGDLNNIPGSASREVIQGRMDPGLLLRPGDCIGPGGEIACELPRTPGILSDLAAIDPDLRGAGSFVFEGRDELIDGLLASGEAARLALEPGTASGDWDLALTGRLRRGSDHRMLRLVLRW